MAIELIQIKDGNFPKTDTINGTGLEYIVVSKADGVTYGMLTSDFKDFLGTVQTIAPRALSPSDPAPTLAGVYKPTVDGTYGNAGGLVVDRSEGGSDEGMAVEFIFDGTDWIKIDEPYPQAINKILAWVDGAYAIGDQRNHNGEDWEATAAILTGEEPGVSPKWSRRLEMVKGSHVSQPLWSIEDENGKVAFRISKFGEIGIGAFEAPTLERIKTAMGITSSTFRNKIFGKKVSILGDSISTANGAAGIDAGYTYIGLLRELQQCTVFVDAVAGSCVSVGGEPTVDFCDDSRWSTLSTNSPDVILIFGGINDFLQDIPLGVLGDTDTTKFYGALNYLYKNVLAANTNSRVFHMTPLHTKFSQGGGLVPEYNGQNYLTDYVDAIKEVAARYGVGVIDTNERSGITCYNIASLSSDLIHVKELGHAMIYSAVVTGLDAMLGIPSSEPDFNILSDNLAGILKYGDVLTVTSSVPTNIETVATTFVNSVTVTMPSNSSIGSNAVVVGVLSDGNYAVMYLDGTGRVVKFWKDGHVDLVTLYAMPSNAPTVAKGSPVTVVMGGDSFTISYTGYSQSILFSSIPNFAIPVIGVLVKGSNTYTFKINK